MALLVRPRPESILKSYRLCPQPHHLGVGWVTSIPTIPLLKGTTKTSSGFIISIIYTGRWWHQEQ